MVPQWTIWYRAKQCRVPWLHNFTFLWHCPGIKKTASVLLPGKLGTNSWEQGKKSCSRCRSPTTLTGTSWGLQSGATPCTCSLSKSMKIHSLSLVMILILSGTLIRYVRAEQSRASHVRHSYCKFSRLILWRISEKHPRSWGKHWTMMILWMTGLLGQNYLMPAKQLPNCGGKHLERILEVQV